MLQVLCTVRRIRQVKIHSSKLPNKMAWGLFPCGFVSLWFCLFILYIFCFMQAGIFLTNSLKQRPYNSAYSMQILWIQCQSFQTNAVKGSEEAEPNIPSNPTVTDQSTLRLSFFYLTPIISVIFPFFNKGRNAKLALIKHLRYMDYTMD